MTLQCDGVNNMETVIMYILTINEETIYVVDGTFYYHIEDIFDSVSI